MTASICSLISTISYAEPAQTTVVATGTAAIIFQVQSNDKTIQGDIATIAISGPVKNQVSCTIGNTKSPCMIQNLPAGRYAISAMGIPDNKQHYQGNATITPITLKTGEQQVSEVHYRQVKPALKQQSS